jgi:hypothetical protein
LRDVARQFAREADSLFRELQDRLGTDFSLGQGGTEFELTPKGQVAIRAGDVTYFRDQRDGTPVASRVKGGRAEFAHVEPDGRMVWQLAPVGDVSQN